MLKKHNIYLIGPMAAGKTTVGKLLSKSLDKDCFDTDAEIIKCTGVDIALIFELEGEEGFRKRETDKLRKLAQLNNVVISTGGGIILKEENRKLMRQTGRIIYLQCSVEQQLSRTKFDKKRPLLQVENPKEKLNELMKFRAPVYESIADIIISTNKTNSKNIIREIIQKLDFKQ
ncbi:MAG: shikimate kinase AroK [Cycloclasticus sp.]|nr:MAG: shikimate kinase AroK [Cycloclasticus sp.]